MPDKMPPNEEKGLRNLMKGNGHDKKIALETLIKHGPGYFSEDILRAWLDGNVYNQARAQKVLEAWGMTEDDFKKQE